MKYDKQLLAATLLLTPALFAFSPRGTKVAFAVEEGSSLTKTFTNSAELTLDDMSMLMNGQESPMMPNIEMTVNTNLEVTVSDDYLAMSEGKPSKLKRNYDTISQATDIAMEIDIMGQVQNEDMSMNSVTELEGKEILFTWSEDDSDYVASFPEDEGDEELLVGLIEDMDLRGFLPEGEVAEGDEWKVPPQTLVTILAPGGNLKAVPEEVDVDMMGMNQDMGDFSDWFSEDMEGEILATFKGTRETEDGARVGVIGIAVEISNAVDMTEKVQESMSETPEGVENMDITGMDLEIELEGEGTLLWDLQAGCVHSFELTGDFAMIMDMAMDISAQGMDMEIEQSMEFSGSMSAAASRD